MNLDQLSATLALRPPDAAKALGISLGHLWKLNKDGSIPHVRLGSGKRKMILYPVEELKNWLSMKAKLNMKSIQDQQQDASGNSAV